LHTLCWCVPHVGCTRRRHCRRRTHRADSKIEMTEGQCAWWRGEVETCVRRGLLRISLAPGRARASSSRRGRPGTTTDELRRPPAASFLPFTTLASHSRHSSFCPTVLPRSRPPLSAPAGAAETGILVVDARLVRAREPASGSGAPSCLQPAPFPPSGIRHCSSPHARYPIALVHLWALGKTATRISTLLGPSAPRSNLTPGSRDRPG
jgi:hypothetical protein